MKNQLVLLTICCLSLLACGNSGTSTETATTKVEKASSTAVNTAQNTKAIAMPDAEPTASTEVDPTTTNTIAGDGSKEKSLQKAGKSKAEAIKAQTNQSTSQSSIKEKTQTNASTVKEEPKNPAPEPVSTQATEKPTPATPVTKKIEEAVEKPAAPVKTEPVKPQFSHTAWDQLLRKYVSANGKVNYKGLKKDKAALNAYTQYLQDNPIQDSWSKSKKIAYWINAYNAFTVKLIVDNYPIASITDLHGGKPWDHKWIKIDGKTYTLNNIENDILRPKYKDARVHFAVNCAAKSCPPLLNRAWTADNLNRNYEKQAKAFINNNQYNKIASGKIEISKIFEWYAVDFKELIPFLNKYSTTKIDAGATVNYVEYDWKLNE